MSRRSYKYRVLLPWWYVHIARVAVVLLSRIWCKLHFPCGLYFSCSKLKSRLNLKNMFRSPRSALCNRLCSEFLQLNYIFHYPAVKWAAKHGTMWYWGTRAVSLSQKTAVKPVVRKKMLWLPFLAILWYVLNNFYSTSQDLLIFFSSIRTFHCGSDITFCENVLLQVVE